MSVLQINELTKNYGQITAVNKLSLTVEAGNIYGILGPNGSGKTTTLGMLLGVIEPDGGDFNWFGGLTGKHARQKIGALLETPNFYPYMNAIDNLKIVAHIKRIKNPKIDEILELVSLTGRGQDPFKTYSLGMKQRLAIGAALIGDPEILILDEPTNGLDPQGIADIRQVIHEIAEQNKTILMASHILDEVEKTCTHVAIIKKGHLLATGSVGAILSDDITVEVGAEDLNALQHALYSLDLVSRIKQENGHLTMQVQPEFSIADLNRWAFNKGFVLTHLVARKTSLESEFLEITK